MLPGVPSTADTAFLDRHLGHNSAGADAAALECNRIHETQHESSAGYSTRRRRNVGISNSSSDSISASLSIREGPPGAPRTSSTLRPQERGGLQIVGPADELDPLSRGPQDAFRDARFEPGRDHRDFQFVRQRFVDHRPKMMFASSMPPRGPGRRLVHLAQGQDGPAVMLMRMRGLRGSRRPREAGSRSLSRRRRPPGSARCGPVPISATPIPT